MHRLLNIYTDASHSDYYKVSACGFVVIRCNKVIQHTVLLVENIKTNVDAELYAAYEAILCGFMMDDVKKIRIYSDNYSVLQAINYTLYKTNSNVRLRFIESVKMCRESGIEVVGKKVRAHDTNELNNKVDESVRMHLRAAIKYKK